MIIDFHTHTFPEELAERAVAKLAKSARAKNYLNGTVVDLRRSMKEAGVDYSVLLPVVTKPDQQRSINRLALEINFHSHETGLLSFGGIHPDNEDYRQILRQCADNGVRGIKLHPIFQQTYLDDIRYLRIIDCACEHGLIILVHAGYDISYPQRDFASAAHILPVLDRLKPDRFILAHMGGWLCWTEAEEQLVGRDVWLDTSFCLLPIRPAPGTQRDPGENPPLGKEQFLRMVRRHGADRILFGTDSPWDPQQASITALKESGLTPEELSAILGDNAAGLLGLAKRKKGGIKEI